MRKKKARGQLIVLSGPSGVGKSTVISELLSERPDIHFSVSFTTRAPRVGEAHGVNYNFVEREEFEAMIANDELLEYAEYVHNYYGTSMKVIEEAIAGRLRKAREEYQEIPNYDYLVVNDKVSEAAAEIIAILTAEGCRTKNRIHLVDGV